VPDRPGYSAGREAGEQAEVVRGHTNHLAEINGSQRDIAERLGKLDETIHTGLSNAAAVATSQVVQLTAAVTAQITTLAMQIQRLHDQVEAQAALARTVADTLEKADALRARAEEQRLSPRMRTLAVITTVVALVGVVASVVFGIRS
jgi:chromosome segregation ATPase